MAADAVEHEEKMESSVVSSRQWIAVDAGDEAGGGGSSEEVTVVTYNILSEELLKASSYFHKIDERHWRRAGRHRLLVAELRQLDADVLCLQEVDSDYWAAALRPSLEAAGYACRTSWRSSPPFEGVATCARASVFAVDSFDECRLSDLVDELIDASGEDAETRERLRRYADAPQRCLTLHLRHRRLRAALAVANAHVSYQRPPRPDLRAAQAVALATRTLAGGGAAVLCGDFNSSPQSLAYAAVTTGGADWPPLSELGADWPLLPALRPALRRGRFLESAYPPHAQDHTVNLTNNSGCVDFIFYTPGRLRPVSVLQLNSWRILRRKDCVPDSELPSDHLSLAARLRLCA